MHLVPPPTRTVTSSHTDMRCRRRIDVCEVNQKNQSAIVVQVVMEPCARLEGISGCAGPSPPDSVSLVGRDRLEIGLRELSESGVFRKAIPGAELRPLEVRKRRGIRNRFSAEDQIPKDGRLEPQARIETMRSERPRQERHVGAQDRGRRRPHRGSPAGPVAPSESRDASHEEDSTENVHREPPQRARRPPRARGDNPEHLPPVRSRRRPLALGSPRHSLVAVRARHWKSLRKRSPPRGGRPESLRISRDRQAPASRSASSLWPSPSPPPPPPPRPRPPQARRAGTSDPTARRAARR